jgi:hypothetical protein
MKYQLNVLIMSPGLAWVEYQSTMTVEEGNYAQFDTLFRSTQTSKNFNSTCYTHAL